MTLCFKEEEFAAKDFNVDKFVTKCKQLFPLDALREDLETHYKSVQLAVVELINRDYGDFVSLSSNLVGTDKTIDHLKSPLAQIQNDITIIKDEMVALHSEVTNRLAERKAIKEKKKYLHHLMSVVRSIEKIEKMLSIDPQSPDAEILFTSEKTDAGHYLERVAGEFNQLQFHVNQTINHPIIENMRPQVTMITSKLQESLEGAFRQGVAADDADLLRSCLRTYALIDRVAHAEQLFANIVVVPFVDGTVNESCFNERGIEKMCSEILQFVERGCGRVLKITSEDHLEGDRHTLKGFDFLLNSVWTHVEQAFETNLPLIFSPGNPDIFLQRYRVMMDFLERFEGHCISSTHFHNLRKHPTYHSFMLKWSLPVYFQIRFQKIGCEIEMAMENPFEKSDSAELSTHVGCIIWACLKRGWEEEVYVAPLKGRFWKLTLQIVSRLATFIEENLSNENGVPVENASQLLADGHKIMQKVKVLFNDVISVKLKHDGPEELQKYSDALDEICKCLQDHLNELSEHVVKLLSAQTTQELEQVKNVPRLYRRTNKEAPSEASKYTATASHVLSKFIDESNTLEQHKMERIISNTLQNVTQTYYSLVDELLTSIRKTEDSLLRLKQQRKAVSGSTASLNNAESMNDGTISDENKIRKQLLLDAKDFGKQIELLGQQSSKFEAYGKLVEITTASLRNDK